MHHPRFNESPVVNSVNGQSGVVTVGGGGGSAASVTKTIAQSGIGSNPTGTWLYFNYSTNLWDLAIGLATTQSDNRADTLCMITVVTDANTVTVCLLGDVTGLTGLTPGQYFLSITTAGAMTPTPPAMPTDEGKVYKPIFVATSSTEGFVQISPGFVLTAVPALTFDTILGGTNTSGAVMIVGNSSQLKPTGSGIITPSNITGLIAPDGTDIVSSGSGTTAIPYALAPSSALIGGAASLVARLAALENYLLPLAVPTVTGLYYDQANSSIARVTTGMGSGGIVLSRFVCARPFTIDTLAAYVVGAGSGTTAKILIYSSDSNGWPGTLIHATSALATTTANAAISESFSYTFSAHTVYWVGIHNSNSGPTFRFLPFNVLPSLGLASNTVATYYLAIARTVTYASGPPSPWTFTSADLYNGGAPSVMMRST